MRLGKIRSYDKTKGHGFLEIDNNRPDLFFYHKGPLEKGALVRFTIQASVKGGIYADQVGLVNE